MSNPWEIAAPHPPPPPSEFLKLTLTALAHPLHNANGATSQAILLQADPYETYLQAHVKYVTYLTELKYKLSCEAAFDKAVKSSVSLDLKATGAALNKTSGRKAIRLMRNKPATRIEPVCDAHLVFKERAKQTPPAPKAEIVAAKNAVRTAKALAKAEKFRTLATKLTEGQKVATSRVKANLTYAQAVVGARQQNATAAASVAAATTHARAFLRRERVESKRVPLYEQRGGNAAMPAEPAGDYLVQRDESTRTRVQRVSTKNGPDVSTVITETFTKD